MPPARLDALLGTTISFHRLDPRSDSDLLSRFLDDQDESAFEALLVRHTPAVRAACRGWLRSPADIDDAAQATFLVLVKRAKSIRNRALLGRWLYGVAVNVARALRRQQKTFCTMPDDLAGREPAAYDDVRDLLAEEITRLPEKYRLPVQLCYDADLTTAEAAQRLGWPKGTVLTRLAWARKRLQQRLTRRGVTPAVFAGLIGTPPPAVGRKWLHMTARAARGVAAGDALACTGISTRTVSLTEGVVRTMMWNKLLHVALAALVAIALTGFGIFQWIPAADGQGNSRNPSADSLTVRDQAKVDDPRPAPTGRRREAVIRLPLGTFVKEVDAAPYGSGRITWTYEEDRVVGLIEASVMGVEVELATEAEIALSGNGTIFGLLTSTRLNHIRLPNGEQFAELQPFVGLWSAVEPLFNEVLTDLPFSYQFRMQGDRLVISNFRILLAGPNPLGKLGGLGLGANNNEMFAVLAYFQAIGTALEGTFSAPDAEKKSGPVKRPLFMKPRGPAAKMKK